MWLLLISIRHQGHRVVLPLPMVLLWPLVMFGALLLMVLPSTLRLDQRRAIASSLLLPFRIGGALVNVTSRDGTHVAVRFI